MKLYRFNPTILILDCGIVLTVWYILLYIKLKSSIIVSNPPPPSAQTHTNTNEIIMLNFDGFTSNLKVQILLVIYIYKVWKTSQRSILGGVGSLWYNDTIQVKKIINV